MLHLATDFYHDGGLRLRRLAFIRFGHQNSEANELKISFHLPHCPVQQQLERAFRRLVLKTLVFQLFKLLQNLHGNGILAGNLQAVLLGLLFNGAPPGKV